MSENNIMGNLGVDDSIKNETNQLGWEPFESDAYDITIETAFLHTSRTGAVGFNLSGKAADGKTFSTQQYITTNADKGCLNYYTKDGKKSYLPGFNVANAIVLLTVGKNLNQLATQEAEMPLFNDKVKAHVLPELAGKVITLGIQKQIVNKRVKDAATGNYVASPETRVENEVDKVFRTSDKLTTPEIRAQETEPAFYKRWLEKNQGREVDKSVKVNGGVANGAPPQKKATGTGAPAENLFANK